VKEVGGRRIVGFPTKVKAERGSEAGGRARKT